MSVWGFVWDAAIAVIAAIVAVRFSLGSFYTQKWWEKRAELYSEILSDLAHMRRSALAYIDQMEGQTMTDNYRAEVQKHWTESNARVEQIRDMGAFVISKIMHEHLELLRAELNPPESTDHPYEQAGRELDALQKAIARVRTTVEKELNPEWWRLGAFRR